MTIEDLGYNQELERFRESESLNMFDVGRVITEHKERYVVKTVEGEYEGEIIGNLRYSAASRSDFPAVGDWVAFSEYEDNKVLIHAVFPRKNSIERQKVGKLGEKQIIATNIDYAFIVQAVDNDFNINRLERYLVICTASKVKPIIILNKVDLIDEEKLIELKSKVEERINDVSIIGISNASQKGIIILKKMLQKGKTYCLLGSSGVGKSSLVNSLSGQQIMKTNTISESTNKGRHITSHRELYILENGGVIIDNPGMREVGIADASEGLERTFERILSLAKSCKFNNCTHSIEAGCEVIAALENGSLEEVAYENFLKVEREKEHFESSVAEKRKKDKDFGKMIKEHKKSRINRKY